MGHLNWQAISHQLNEEQKLQLKEYRLETEVGSTNEIALQQFCRHDILPAVCVAESQTQGRGRHGRSWISPKSANIYMSLAWAFSVDINELQRLSLATGVVIAEMLESYGLQVDLKWPNDIQLKGKKIAGILLESQIKKSGQINLVMGVGLNIDMPNAEAVDIDQLWTDMRRENKTGVDLNSNEIAGKLLCRMMQLCNEYEKLGFEPYRNKWQNYDVCTGMSVKIKEAEKVCYGTCLGINDEGALRVMIDGGEQIFYGADVSIRVGQDAAN